MSNKHEHDYGKSYFEGESSAFYLLGYKERKKYWDNLEELVRRYKDGGKVLDIGCAYGFLLRRLENDFECYGSDISEHAIKKAKENTNAKLKVNDICNQFPFDEKFDMITLLDLIEHVKCPEKTLGNCYNHLKENGILIIKTPNRTHLRNFLFGGLDLKEGHIKLFKDSELYRLLKRKGFRIKGCYRSFTDLRIHLLSSVKISDYKENKRPLTTEMIWVAKK